MYNQLPCLQIRMISRLLTCLAGCPQHFSDKFHVAVDSLFAQNLQPTHRARKARCIIRLIVLLLLRIYICMLYNNYCNLYLVFAWFLLLTVLSGCGQVNCVSTLNTHIEANGMKYTGLIMNGVQLLHKCTIHINALQGNFSLLSPNHYYAILCFFKQFVILLVRMIVRYLELSTIYGVYDVIGYRPTKLSGGANVHG